MGASSPASATSKIWHRSVAKSSIDLPDAPLSPNQMGPDEYARVANYARRQHPDVMEEQVRSQPWFIKAMGNPIVMGALGVIAAKMLQHR